MGRPKGWKSDQTGRPVERSPGGHQRAAESIGCGSGPRSDVVSRAWRRLLRLACRRSLVSDGSVRVAGCLLSAHAPLSGRYLQFSEREEIALLRARGCGCGEIARQIGRSPSTISREFRRNAATRGGSCSTYRASTAQWHADRRRAVPEARQARCQQCAATLCAGSPVGHCAAP